MSLARSIVLRGLEGLEDGRLRLELPDGSVRVFGRGPEEGRELSRDRQVGDGGESGPGDAPRPTPDARLRVTDPAFFRRLLLDGETGAGASYIEGEWETDDLVDLVRLGIRNRGALKGAAPLFFLGAARDWIRHRLRRNTRAGSRRNIRSHYDLGNDFFALFLDGGLTYSCALFDDGDRTLAEAQRAKYRRIAEKARIRPGQRVLEIGCGWGGFAEFVARERGARVTGLTVSPAQAEHARRRMAEAGLTDRVDVELTDYREVDGEFDRVVSIEMLEAVGHEYLETYFGAVDRALAPGGRAVVQVITIPDRRYAAYRRRPDFIQRFVFPGSHLPSLGAMSRAMGKGSRLVTTDLEDIGPHYAETLRRWRLRFDGRREEARRLGYGDDLLRLWEFYLAYCEAGFLERYIQDHQMVLVRSADPALSSGSYAGAGVGPARTGSRGVPGGTGDPGAALREAG